MKSRWTLCVSAIVLLGAAVLSGAVTPMEFAPLPYPFDALEPHIDAKTMEIHYDRHHRAYFNNFTGAAEGTELEHLSWVEIFDGISRWPVGVRNNAGGHFNHTLFWVVMSPEGGGGPTGTLAEAIDRDFGSVDAFREKFDQAALGVFGSGWAWLSVAGDGSLFVSSTPNQDNPLMDVVDPRGIPILGLDVWEHAYYLNYQNQRGRYATAFWNVVDWDAVGRLWEGALKRIGGARASGGCDACAHCRAGG